MSGPTDAQNDASPAGWQLVAAVVVAVSAVSAAAIFIRLADAPPLAIAFWRNAIAALVFIPIAGGTRSPLPAGRALGLTVLSGLTLAAHFGLWITSLAHTSVAASVVLVCTQPVFVAVAAWVLFGERLNALAIAGISTAVAGSVIIGLDGSLSESAATGNLLALGGAVAVAAYVLLGRGVRTGGVGLFAYTSVAYSTAALALLATCIAFDVALTGFSNATWGWLLAIAVFPQILGHTLFNWALKYVRAAILSSTILAEPVVSAALAWVILAEVPGPQTLVGGAAVLVGLFVLIRGRG